MKRNNIPIIILVIILKCKQLVSHPSFIVYDLYIDIFYVIRKLFDDII